MSTRTNSYIVNNPTTFGSSRPVYTNSSVLLNGTFNKSHDFANANALNFSSGGYGTPPPSYQEVTLAQTAQNMQVPETTQSTRLVGGITGATTMGIGLGLAGLDSAANDFVNARMENQARTGSGPNGHAFDAMAHAQNQVSVNNAHEAFRSSALMLGSALGPEGLIGAGVLSAADYAVQAMTAPSENTTNSTSGDMVNASNIS
uniref:Uncharacterized protein n=1 Tax=Hammarskog picorna-like virus TaxID=2665417 RepID=A0A5Q0V0H7_9VIRU|nr:hypothetical protein [Hammarskog picorna-like virus]